MSGSGDVAMPKFEEIPKLCSPVHVCFPPRDTYCLICKETDPTKCLLHPERRGETRG